MLEEHFELVAIDGVMVVFWSIASDGLYSVGTVEREVSKTIAYLTLLGRVNLVGFVWSDEVVGADATCILDDFVGCRVLCFAKECTACAFCAAITSPRSDFSQIEWELVVEWMGLCFAEFLAPHIHHRVEASGMVLVLTYIGFALIPDESLDGVVAERVEHSVIHDERCEPFPPLTVPTAL